MTSCRSYPVEFRKRAKKNQVSPGFEPKYLRVLIRDLTYYLLDFEMNGTWYLEYFFRFGSINVCHFHELIVNFPPLVIKQNNWIFCQWLNNETSYKAVSYLIRSPSQFCVQWSILYSIIFFMSIWSNRGWPGERAFSEAIGSAKFRRRFFDRFFVNNSRTNSATNMIIILKIFKCNSASNGV